MFSLKSRRIHDTNIAANSSLRPAAIPTPKSGTTTCCTLDNIVGSILSRLSATSSSSVFPSGSSRVFSSVLAADRFILSAIHTTTTL